MTTRQFRERVTRRARKVGIALPAALCDGLEAYFRLLVLWNRKINLTSLPLTDAPDATVDRLLIEPLVAVRHLPIESSSSIDIGSGGGSPAIPMKLARPQMALRMVEAKTRKSAFLLEAVRHLGLEGVSVETARFEELLARPELHEAHDVATMRAIRVDVRVLINVQAFLRSGGRLLLFRGPSRADVSPELTPPLFWEATHPLIESAGSRLLVIRKAEVGAARLL